MAKTKVKAKSHSKTVQIEMNDLLLDVVDKCAKQLHYTREQFIQQACLWYAGRIDKEGVAEMEREAYRRQPDDTAWGEVGAQLMAEALTKGSE
jgi:hypothetical protein